MSVFGNIIQKILETFSPEHRMRVPDKANSLQCCNTFMSNGTGFLFKKELVLVPLALAPSGKSRTRSVSMRHLTMSVDLSVVQELLELDAPLFCLIHSKFGVSFR